MQHARVRRELQTGQVERMGRVLETVRHWLPEPLAEHNA